MFTKKELEERKGYIGASECAGVLGLSRWQTPLQIWAVKTGQIDHPDISNKLPVKLGVKMEQIVSDLFTEETGKKVRKVTEAYTHKKHDFIRCHIDRKVEGESAILQCKAFSAYRKKEFEGEEIPQECLLQEYHELACTGYKKAYIAALLGNEKFVIKEVLRDEKIISDIIKREVNFWKKYVIPKVMPIVIKASDDDTLQAMFPNAIEKQVIALPDSANQIIENLESAGQDCRLLAKDIKKLKNELKALIGENETGVTQSYSITWKNIHKDAYHVPEQDFRQLFYKKIEEEK